MPDSVDLETLSIEASSSRPDLLAAEQAVAAAAERLRLSKLVWFRMLGILDATSGQDTGHEFGPAVRTTLPIFNWNQGSITRAEAELEKAERQRQTVRNQVLLDVQQAELRFAQSRAELDVLRQRVRNDVETAIRRTEIAYQEGETPYVVVLQTTQQLVDTRVREAQLEADVRRTWAELERSVGRHLTDITADVPPLVPRRNLPLVAPQDAPADITPQHP
jgi:cobalt-zinc-cadmium efflux system outer membrane protein